MKRSWIPETSQNVPLVVGEEVDQEPFKWRLTSLKRRPGRAETLHERARDHPVSPALRDAEEEGINVSCDGRA